MRLDHFKLKCVTIVLTVSMLTSTMMAFGKSNDYGTFNTNVVNGYQNLVYKNANIKYDVYVYKSSSQQSIAPAIRVTGKKDYLSDMNPNGVSTTQAKVNGSTMETFRKVGTSFYGLYYFNGVLYKDGEIVPKGFANPTLANPDSGLNQSYFPSFCIAKNNTVSIKWPSTTADFLDLKKNCATIISGQHPVVYNNKTVFENKSTLRSLDDKSLIWDHFHETSGYINKRVNRTLVGHRTDGSFVLVCGIYMTLKTAGQLMKDLGCDYAVNMDGGPGTQMRITGIGRVTPEKSDYNYYGSAVVIFNKTKLFY